MKMAQKAAVLTLLAVTATACDNILGVDNLNQPDIERVFATPAAIQQTIGSGYQSVHNTLTSNDNLMPQLLTISGESYSSINNFQMGPRGGIPRVPVLNSTGAASVFGAFSGLSRGGRLAVNALNALDKLMAEGGTLGSVGNDLRTRAFGFFVIGVNQGWLATIYDQAGLVRSGMASDEVPELGPYTEVMAIAIAMLDSAEAIASQTAAAAGFPMPGSWVGASTEHASQAGFLRLVRSFRARFMAGVARTPAEREFTPAVWTRIRNDAEAGLTTDFLTHVGGSTGWNQNFVGTLMFQDGRAWSQMTLMYFGMADTTGAYTAWLATPLDNRVPFLVRTPDPRWPRGETRAIQVDNSPLPEDQNSKPYIRASLENEIGDAWGWSFYQFSRTRAIRESYFMGPSEGLFMEINKAEIDLLLAEAKIRLNDVPGAIAIIDQYRLANDLPSLAGLTSRDATIPGADYVVDGDGEITGMTAVAGKANCVPRVPTSAGNATMCGTVWEAMKYEKRMETAYSSYGRWWIDNRGWGDLVENTHTEYPVPFQEMDARQLPPYSLGGGLASSAARGTYGF
ncbi:MAG TPA: hypothetical protein VMM18_03670 [Gemmatimonadaceae bacterium]|nr:hypothetical protein [Gemmatimonadaceae bacterium]